jgi:hypothetical protein
MSILSRRPPSLFTPREFNLFDSTTFAVVNPNARTFAPAPADPFGERNAVPTHPHAVGTIREGKVTLDTVRRGEIVGGVPTQYYRVTAELIAIRVKSS